MKSRSIVILVVISTCFAHIAEGQNNSREFIESSSPLAGGERVISRSEPGRDVQTVITVSAESIAKRAEQSNRNRIDLTTQRVPQSRPVNNTGSTAGSTGVDRYPYPAANRVANVGYSQAAYQLPTLGIGSARIARRPQLFSNCNCNPQTFSAGRVAVPPGTQVTALQAPSLTIQDPSQAAAAFQQPATAQPAFQQPSLAFQNTGSWWDPIVTGSGVYQPIVRMANVKPGTYLGQGIVGQPTAYVDGQPVRNLLRYIFP